MAELQQFRLRVDLGRLSDIQQLSAVLRDLSAVCTAAGALQGLVDRNQAVYDVLRRPGPYLDEWFDLDLEFLRPRRRWPYGAATSIDPLLASSPGFNQAVSERMQSSVNDSRVRVVRLEFSNPLELVIVASGAVVISMVRLLRDWPARRALNDAVAQNYRDTAHDRARVRQIIIEQLASGEHRLSAEQVADVFTAEVADAMLALGDARLEIEGPADPGGE